jgi:hypothetical protein
MNTPKRIAIEVILPALIAAVGTPVYHALVDFDRFSATNIPLLVVVVFAGALIPSTSYMILVEIVRYLGLAQKKGSSVFSAGLGAAIGLGFLVAIGDTELWTRSMADYLFVVILGGASGALVAFAVSEKKEPGQPQEPTHFTRGSS